MSKYSYFSVHDLKDLAMIYHDCDDYKVTVWNPDRMKHMNFIFTGSSNVKKEVNFNATFDDDESMFTFNAVKEALATSSLSEEEQKQVIQKFVDIVISKS